MKVAKKLFRTLLWILGAVLLVVLALPLWIGPVARTLVNNFVPKKTGTSFHLGLVSVNPYCGSFSVGDMQLWNPTGFVQKMAVTLGSLNVGVDMGSLAGDPVIIREVAVKDVFVSYVMNARGENNFSVIGRHAAGGKKVETPDAADVEPKNAERVAETRNAGAQNGDKRGKSVVIDHVKIQGAMVQLGPIMLPVPDVELSGIGRKSNGVTVAEAWDQIYKQVLQSLSGYGVNVRDFANGIQKASFDQMLKAAGSVGNLAKKKERRKAVKNIVDAITGGVDAAGKATFKTTETVGEATSKTVDAVEDETSKAVNAIKGLFK